MKTVKQLKVKLHKTNLSTRIQAITILTATFFIFGIGLLLNFVQFNLETDLDFNNLQFENNTESIEILDNNGNTTYETEINSVANINELNNFTKNAFIAIEDKRFYSHSGIDYKRILSALATDIKTNSFSEGASTITQQLIKNTHLSQEKTIKRKLNEMNLAKQLERYWSKEQILEAYLNLIYFGNNITGIEHASMFYFGIPAKDINLKQSTILAGLIKSPATYDPITNYEKANERANLVLKCMLEQEYISQEEYNTAKNETPTIIGSFNFPKDNSYENQVMLEACEILNTNKTDLLNHGYKIVTYKDGKMQNNVESELANGAYMPQNTNGISPDTLCIVANNEQKGIVAYSGKSKTNLSNLKRMPGSVIKPIFVYAPAIETTSLTSKSLILDEKVTLEGYSPSNLNERYYGWVSVDTAVQKSLNVPAIKIVDYTGIDTCKQIAEMFGIEFTEEDNSLSLALGGFYEGVSLKQLAGAYSVFATDGKYEELKFIKEIYDKNDKLIYSRKTFFQKAISKETSDEITEMLKNVAETGTAKRLAGLNLASKTGTVASNVDSSKNTDAYNLSFNEKYTYAVWQGNTSGENGLLESEVNGGTYPTIFIKNLINN